MKTKIFMMFCWLFYIALNVVAFVNPDLYGYLPALDSARTLYLIIHIPLLFLASLFAFILAMGKSKLHETIRKDAYKIKEDSEKWKKFNEEMANMDKMTVLTFINRVIYYPTAIVTFIVLNDHFLGGVMLVSIFVSLLLIDQIKSFGKEIQNAIS